jgi:hypothetical protein
MNKIDHSSKQFAAACGLFCPGCSLYIATTEDPERLKRIAGMFGIPEEEAKCLGCRSEVRGPYCRTCHMLACADEKGLEFCAECPEYPCEELKEFQAAMPHRADLFENGARIREIGFESWSREASDEYSCRQCGTINSAYDLACRKCGNDPSCSFVERNGKAIEKFVMATVKREGE